MAILIALAKRPQGRATLDELANEVARLIAETDKKIGNSKQLSALDHVDIFQSGLVASEDDSLWITENGWSLLHALGISAQEWPDSDFASTSQSLDLIDDLIGTEARLKIFEASARRRDGEIASDAPAGYAVTFDVDVLDPGDAPGSGTLVRGGLTYREAHLGMEKIAEAGGMRSLEVVEINTALDVNNKTAELGVELILSALGKTIL